MTRSELNKLHQKHLKYLMDNSPTDYIVEDHGIYRGRDEPTSEFVISAGGDVSVYRVIGYGPDFKLYER